MVLKDVVIVPLWKCQNPSCRIPTSKRNYYNCLLAFWRSNWAYSQRMGKMDRLRDRAIMWNNCCRLGAIRRKVYMEAGYFRERGSGNGLLGYEVLACSLVEIIFYRLKQVDFNGEFTYTDTKQIKVDAIARQPPIGKVFFPNSNSCESKIQK